MSENNFQVSDNLFAWRRSFLPFENSGILFTPEDLRRFNASLMACALLARVNERELIGSRWKLRANNPDAVDAMLAEFSRPGTNLILFKPNSQQLGA